MRRNIPQDAAGALWKTTRILATSFGRSATMNLETLCGGIDLQPEIREKVFQYYHSDDFCQTTNLLDGLANMETESFTRAQLKQIFQTDERQVKMLTCMLVCAVRQHAWYAEKGIPDTIFFDTMRCFTRFIGECKKIAGAYAFDREWWTARQLSGVLFRIGELEFEKIYEGKKPLISIHIPSDSILTKERCDQSFADAECFFAEYFPEFPAAEYVCNSWLLAPELEDLLPEDSRILAFQKRFLIREVEYSEEEYIEWVFKTRSRRIADFPEKSTLQKNMKRYLLDGGKIGNGMGVLRMSTTPRELPYS